MLLLLLFKCGPLSVRFENQPLSCLCKRLPTTKCNFIIRIVSPHCVILQANRIDIFWQLLQNGINVLIAFGPSCYKIHIKFLRIEKALKDFVDWSHCDRLHDRKIIPMQHHKVIQSMANAKIVTRVDILSINPSY